MTTLPPTMRRVEFSKYGGRDVMSLATAAAVPTPKESQILVRVSASSLNPVDYKIRDGGLRSMMPIKFPSGIGYDVAGEVVALGPNVTEFAVGDRVMARSRGMGTVAEYAAVDVGVAAKLPDKMDFQQGAALPLAGETALQGLRQGGLKEGEAVLILGGAGGVGTFAVQLARHVFGAKRVVATCSPKKFALVKDLGAHEAVDYHDPKAPDALKAQFDVVFDCSGEAARWARAIKPGRLVVSIAAVPTPASLERNHMKVGFIVKLALTLMSRKVRKAASAAGGEYQYMLLRPNGADLAELGGYVAAGKIRCVVDLAVGLDKFQEAFERIESGRATGKVVITVP